MFVYIINYYTFLHFCLQRRSLEFTAQNMTMCEEAAKQIKAKAYPSVSLLSWLNPSEVLT